MSALAAEPGAVDENDDSWLYGDGDGEPQQPPRDEEAPPLPPPPQAEPESAATDAEEEGTVQEPFEESHVGEPEVDEDDAHFEDEHFEDGEHRDEGENGDSQENGDSDSDDSEDNVKVILGDVKSLPPSYPSLNIKRGGLIVQSGVEKQKPTGKFNVEEFEAVGTINGVPAQEFNIDVLEDKPWRKPGADLTDYFNYGFNEDTWRAYCERQKRMRIHESGTGLIPLGGNSITGIQQPRHPTPILNDNSKYAVGFTGIRKAGPPPGRKLTGPIDVIGGRRDGSANHEENAESPMKQSMQIPVRENTIQVMTADRREYSRNKPFPDMTLPPPSTMVPPPADFFHGSADQSFYPPPYHQNDTWGNSKGGWTPSDIKELTPAPMGGISSMGMPPLGPNMGPPPNMSIPSVLNGPPPNYGPPHMHMHHREMDMRDRDMSHRDRDKDLDEMRDKDDHEDMRDRNRDRDRSRSSKPDRQREKSHRRERSRSRSRRHKSRSRSPTSRHRSKKKTSHRKDKEDSD